MHENKLKTHFFILKEHSRNITNNCKHKLRTVEMEVVKGKLWDFSTWALFLDLFGSKLLLRTINDQNRSSIELEPAS